VVNVSAAARASATTYMLNVIDKVAGQTYEAQRQVAVTVELKLRHVTSHVERALVRPQ
jgi:hypothetical protein